MPTDKLKQFLSLRDELTAEKREIETRLAQLNRILGAPSGYAAPDSTAGPGRRPGRLPNKLSLKSAILKVNTRPMTKQEILDAVLRLGYKFATNNPMNSVNVILYGRKPKFKNANGEFSPA